MFENVTALEVNVHSADSTAFLRLAFLTLRLIRSENGNLAVNTFYSPLEIAVRLFPVLTTSKGLLIRHNEIGEMQLRRESSGFCESKGIESHAMAAPYLLLFAAQTHTEQADKREVDQYPLKTASETLREALPISYRCASALWLDRGKPTIQKRQGWVYQVFSAFRQDLRHEAQESLRVLAKKGL